MRALLTSSLFALGCLLIAPSAPVAADKPAGKKVPAHKAALAEARKRLLAGNYDEARTAYDAAVKTDKTLAPYAAVGIAESHRLVGDTEVSRKLLDAAKKEFPDNLELLAARADLLYELGDWDAAEIDADAALANDKNQLRAVWTKGRIQRDRGEVDAADKTFRLAVKHYTARSNADDDITDPEELLHVALSGAENARWHNLKEQFRFILNDVLKDALAQDKGFWPAEQLAGELLLEKYNRPDAIDAFDKALAINPKAADPLAGKAQAALVKFDLKDADKFADDALKQNPTHAVALRVKAEIQVIAGDFPAAEALLLKAKLSRPRDSQTLGRLAGVQLLQNKKTDFDAAVKEVSAFDTKPGLFYHELAACLDERKRYTQAEEYYKKAAELRPFLSGPRTSLGMLYLRLGNEVEGKKLLAAAFKADPFNVRVANSIKVLTHLEKYETLQTAHYLVRFDPLTDKILAEFLAEFLEETHAELKKQFAYEPEGRILIEVFNSHEMFSGRTVGLPDLHTIGACTGRVVAMASPKAKGLSKPFNWGRVMRHELTHIFNLAQTDYQCPHWVTEGLAVRNENMSRSPAWTAILRDRFASKTLLNLDTILLGFVRPKNPDEWTLAYCQSQIYMDYLTKTHGEEAVAKVLNEYKAGKDTASVIRAACGVGQAEFEAGYREFVAEILKGSAPAGGPVEKALTFDELVEAVKESPKDNDLKARLAEQHLRRNKVTDAKKLVDEILEAKPGHGLASIVKSKLLDRAKDPEGAKAALDEGLEANPNDVKLIAGIARLHLGNKEFPEAAKMFEKAKKLAPLEADWNEQLVRIYKMTGESEKLLPLLKEVVGHDPDDLDARLKLAKAALDASRFAEAEVYARDALCIDVTNAEARESLLDSLKGQNKTAEAEKIRKRFEK